MNLRIDATNPSLSSPSNVSHASGAVVAGSPAAAPSPSAPAADPDSDVDTQRVAELQAAIASGQLTIHPEKIANAVLVSAQELLQGSKP